MARKTPGSKSDSGSKYEISVIALFASLLSKNENVEDYHIFSNFDEAQPFDDIVAEVHFRGLEPRQIYAIQVKSGRDKLNINKYCNGYDKIMREGGLKLGESTRSNRIQFWYFCSKKPTNNSFPLETSTNIIELTLRPRSRPYNLHESIFSNTAHFELFSEDPSMIDCQNFFNNFSLFLNQSNTQTNVHVIKGIWRIDDPLQILSYLENYFDKNTSGLDKRAFEHELLRNRLSSYMVIPTTAIQFHHDAVEEWNQLTLEQNVTIVCNELNIEQYLFGCILRNICTVISVDEWNNSVKNMGKLDCDVKNRLKTKTFKPQTLKDLVVQIWMDGKAPLLLRTDIALPFIQDFSHLNKSYVIIDSDVNKRYVEIKNYGLTAFRHLADVEAEELMSGILISMQGRKPASLCSIINGDRELRECITCVDIINMMKPRGTYLKQECLDGNNSILFIIETTNPQQQKDEYRPTGNNIINCCRSGESYEIYKRTKEDPKFRSYAIIRLRLIDDNKLILIPGINGTQTIQEDREEHVLGSFFIDEQKESIYNMEDENPVPILGEAPIHICPRYIPRYLREGDKDSEGNSLIEGGCNKDNVVYNGKRFAEKDFFNESTATITAITGEPGVGKTTLLHSLFRLCESQYYVVFVNLTRCQVDLHERNPKLLQNPLGFWCNKHHKLPYNRFLTNLCDYHDRIVLLLDAFDEVIATCEEQVLELIQNLQKIGLKKIIIASRLICVDLLIDNFKAEIFKIENFHQQFDKDYIDNWNLNLNALHHIPSEFLTNPLYLNMLRTISDNGFNLDVIANRWNLYESIVNLKMKDYCRRMKPHLLDENEKHNILSYHYQLALETVFGGYNVAQKLYQTKQTKKVQSARRVEPAKLAKYNKFMNFGFISHFDINQNPIFIHHTFAEFFVLQWLIENIDNNYAACIYMLMLKNKRYMLDMLSEKHPLHKAILHESVEKIEKLCTENNNYLLEVDDLGRSVLHLAAITCSRDYFHKSNRLNVLLHRMRKKGFDIYVRDKIMNWTWINYWENYVYVSKCWKDEHVATLEAYLGYYATHIEELRHSKFSLCENFNRLYNAAIKYSSIDMIRNLLFLKYRNDKIFLEFRRCLNSQLLKKKKLLNFKFRGEKLEGVHLACIYSNTEAVKIYVENRANLKKTDIFNCTPLHYSVMSTQNNEIVKLLLTNLNISNPHAGQDNHTTILHMSVRACNVNSTKMLLERVDVNLRDAENCTALLAAIESSNDGTPDSKHLKIIKTLIQYKVALNFEALDLATIYGKKDILEILTKYGANVNFSGDTLLCKAIKKENKEIIELLLRHGANVNHVDHNGWTPLIHSIITGNTSIIGTLLDCNADVNFKCERNLAYICGKKKEERTEDTQPLLKNVEDINYGDVYCETVLSMAVVMENKNITQMLLNYNANVNSRNFDNQTPLYLAINTKNMEIIELLLKSGAEVSLMDLHGWDPLSYAIYGGHKDVVQILLNYNADVNFKNDYDRTPLYKAIYTGNLDIIQLVLNCGAQVNILDSSGWSPLTYAVHKGNASTVEMLLDYNANVNFNDGYGHTPLHYAIETRDLVITELLLKRAAQVNILDLSGWSPLSAAIDIGDKDTVEMLLDYNANVNIKDNNNRTPLYTAIEINDLQIIELLLKRDAMVDILDLSGCSPLSCAIDVGNKHAVEMLLNHNANANIRQNNNRTPLYNAIETKHFAMTELLLKYGAQVNILDLLGWSPLKYAIHMGSNVIAHLLLRYSAKVNFKDGNDRTPLDYAIERNNLEIMELLLKCGGQTSIQDSSRWSDTVDVLFTYYAGANIKEYYDDTPLYDAIARENLENIKSLLKCGAQVNVMDSSRWSPLTYAIHIGNNDTVEMLLNYNANMNFKNNDGLTPLHYAIVRKNFEAIEPLLKYGAQVNILDSSGWSPLKYAIHKGNKDTVEMLLNYNANANFKDNENDTPLCDAIKTRNLEIIEMLLKGGAQINILGSLGWSPLSYAIHIGNKDIVEILLNYNADVNIKDKSGGRPMHYAVKTRNLEITKLLLKRGAKVNILDTPRRSPLTYAVQVGNKDIAHVLLEGDADVNFEDENDRVPLSYAIERKNIEIIELLLKYGAQLNILDSSGRSPLCHAVHIGNQETVEMLLTYNADVNMKDRYGDRPLHYAVKTRNVEITELLLKRDAQVNILDSPRRSALSYAVQVGNKNIARLLLDCSADVNFKDEEDLMPLDYAIHNRNVEMIALLLKRGADVNFLNLLGRSPLSYLVEIGNKDIFRMLLDYNADVNIKDMYGFRPLHYAIRGGNVEMIELLLRRGAQVNILDSSTRNPLSYAVEVGNKNIAHMLLKGGADVNFKDDFDRVPLHYAIEGKNVEVIELLLKCGADVNIKDKYGDRPLHRAVKTGNLEITELLLTRGAQINILDSPRRSPLSYAVQMGNKDIVRMLLRCSADVNFKDEEDRKPLDYAIEERNVEIVELLLKCGAQINIEDSLGWNPLSKAIHAGNKDIVEILLNYNADVNFENKIGRTPLYYAIDSFGVLDITELLLKLGAQVNILDLFGFSPLSYAISGRKLDTIEMLLNYNAVVNFKNNDGCTALHYAVKINDLEITKLLLKHGAQANILDSSGCTPLSSAIEMCGTNKIYKRIVKILLNHNADVNLVNNDGRTPLYYAIEAFEALDITELLLKRGAQVNILDLSGHSPLSYAISRRKTDIVEMILNCNADVNLKNSNGRTSLFYAIEIFGDLKITKLLLKRGVRLNTEDLLGFSPLSYAVHIGNQDAVEVLLKCSANVNIEDKNRTPHCTIQ